MAVPVAAIVKTAVAVLSNEKTRKTGGWVVAVSSTDHKDFKIDTELSNRSHVVAHTHAVAGVVLHNGDELC